MHAWSADQLDHHPTQRLLWFLAEQLQEPACKSSGCILMTLSTFRICDTCAGFESAAGDLTWLLGFFATERVMEPQYSASWETGLADMCVVVAG